MDELERQRTEALIDECNDNGDIWGISNDKENDMIKNSDNNTDTE